jgi:2-methylcitrate dehydratase PrpD
MLKDGSGWGAMAGISAGMLAARGFTGAPAVTVESAEVAAGWQDVGSRWLIMEQGFKAHAVCWWAQPAIEAVLHIAREHPFAVEDIAQIEIETFEKATHLAHPRPATTEEAQYSLPFPVATALRAWLDGAEEAWYGVGPRHLLESKLHDERTLALAGRIRLIAAPDLTACFPARFLARARLVMKDGRVFASGDTTFRGEQDFPLSQAELQAKYRWLAKDILQPERIRAIEAAVFDLPVQPTIHTLLAYLSPPPEKIS